MQAAPPVATYSDSYDQNIEMLGFTFWFYIKGKEDLVTSSSESISVFRSSGLELLPTLLSAAAL